MELLPIGLEIFITRNLLNQKLPNLNMLLLGHILRCGRNLRQLRDHLTRFLDFIFEVIELGFHPEFLHTQEKLLIYPHK